MNNKNVSKIIITVLIIQSVAGLIIFFFALNLFTNPDSSFNRQIQRNIESYAKTFKPLNIVGSQGEKGEKGDTGDTGQQGEKGDSIKGEKGDKGDTGANGQDGLSIVGPQGERGNEGAQGQQGIPGPRAEFRCNPDTAENEYKYPGDEDWTSQNSKCVPVNGGEHEQQ